MAGAQEQSSAWAKLPYEPPSAVIPFTLDIPAQEIDDLQTLLKLGRLAPQTYENSQNDGRYGVSHEWMVKAVDAWKNAYDWPARQAKINRHPQFKAAIEDDEGEAYDFHFMALFSKRRDALPLVMLHGWPGSFLEFLDVFDLIRSTYQPESSPYHVIVPSLPGFTLTSGPPLTKDFGYQGAARLVNKLMVTLGFSDGYAVQGGDAGGIMAPVLATLFPHVKAIHVNDCVQPKPNEFLEPEDDPDSTEMDLFKSERTKTFFAQGGAYADLHATRPATAGFVLGSNPIALLAWVGEKLLQWVDPRTPLPMEKMLDSITLYWLSNSIARNLYIYRDHERPGLWCMPQVKQPVGYSRFKYGDDRTMRKWMEAWCDLQFFKDHDAGGHFAAWEKPELLWPDVEEFFRKVWPEKFV